MNSHVANIDVKVVRVPESNVPYLFCHIINVNNMHSFNLKSQFLLDLLSVKGLIFFLQNLPKCGSRACLLVHKSIYLSICSF